MSKNINSKVVKIVQILRRTKHHLQIVYSSLSRNRENDEWGRCTCCGNFTRFKYIKYYDMNSKVVQSCKWDQTFTEVINITNTSVVTGVLLDLESDVLRNHY